MTTKAIVALEQGSTRSSRNPTHSASDRPDFAAVVSLLRRQLVFVFIIAASSSAWAQAGGAPPTSRVPAQLGTGTIQGHATDPDHVALQGARVELQPAGATAVSDDQGHFALPGVPAGNYTLTVSYIGFSPFSGPVVVTAGQVVQANAALGLGSVTQEIVVRGERESGELEAINRERTADNIIEVLPADVITSLPNTNVADALGRLPGLSLERDEGEGKYIQIRGTEPRLSNVTINGVHVSSPERDVRNVKLDIIPADLVESIQVSKTLSANQDGDAIGGSVDLETRTADDRPFYTVSGLYGYTPIINGRSLTEYDGTFSQRFGGQNRLGVAFGGSYDYNGRGYNNIEPSPGTQDFGSGPVPTFSGIHLREYMQRRHRYGFAGSTDYRLHNGSSAYVRGLFAEFKDFGDTWNVQPDFGTLSSPNSTDPNAADGAVVIRHLNRTPEQRIYSIAAGERLNFRQSLFNYQFAVSRERQDGQFPSTYFAGPSDLVYQINTADPYTPRYTVLSGGNINDPAAYQLTKTIGAIDPVRELDYEGSVSLAHHYLKGSHFGSFDVGAKIRSGDKTNKTYEPVNLATGSPLVLYSQVRGNAPRDPNFYFGNYTLPPLSDYNKILGVLAANPSAVALDIDSTHMRSDPNNYHTVERIYAVYAMNTISFGRARVETGVRIETTQSHFTGYKVIFGTVPDPVTGALYQSTAPVAGDHTYVNVLPSVNFQYAFTPNTILRAGYGRGIARPNFSDLPPTILESDVDSQITVGNPNLKPTSANNFDVLMERYLTHVGRIQGGVFYKDLRDPIFSGSTLITSGPLNGFTQIQPINGEKAHIFGFEAAYQQLFTFLPGPTVSAPPPTTAVLRPTRWFPAERTIPHWRGRDRTTGMWV
jgi:TonB-dependent receptor